MGRLIALALCVLVCAAVQPAAAETEERCRDNGYLSGFDVRVPAGPCEVVAKADIHWEGQVAHLRAIRQIATPMSEDRRALLFHIQQLAQRVGAGMSQMHGLALGNITILLSDFVSPVHPFSLDDGMTDKGLAQAWTLNHDGECPIVGFKSSFGMNGSKVRFARRCRGCCLAVALSERPQIRLRGSRR